MDHVGVGALGEASRLRPCLATEENAGRIRAVWPQRWACGEQSQYRPEIGKDLVRLMTFLGSALL